MEELLGDINTNMRSVLDEASSIVGEDLADEFFGLPEEILIDLEQGLPKAIKEGKTVPYLEGVRTRMLDHFDEMGDTVVQRVAQEAEKRMAAGEVHALPEMTANMFDNFSEYHVVHYKQMQHLDNYFTRNMSAEVIDRTWKRIKDGNNAWFNRGYKRLQGVGKGIERGWNKKFPDTPLPNQFSDNLKTLGDEWKKFHKIKNSDLEKYFKAKRAGKTPKTSFEDLRTKHTEMYREMVEVEDGLLSEIEDIVVEMMPFQERGDFKAAYRQIAEMRRKDKMMVLEFYDEARTNDEFVDLFRGRWDNWNQMRTRHQDIIRSVGAEDIRRLAPDAEPMLEAQESVWFNKYFMHLDAIEEAALSIAQKKPLKLADELPQNVLTEVEGYLNYLNRKAPELHHAATRFAEFRSDAALLNYSRRYNYNTFLGTLMPYEFWMTQSMAKWALHSIDRPAMLTTYLRIKQLLETSGVTDQHLPTRLKGNIKVRLPFKSEMLEPVLGSEHEVFVDPLRALLPFDQMSYAIDEYVSRKHTAEGRAEFLLDEWAQEGQITQEQADKAVEEQSGELWDAAFQEIINDDAGLKHGWIDVAQLLSSPHAPIVWGKNIIEGTPEEIGPFMPLTRYSKGISALFGHEDVSWLPHNLEARLRQTMGLPAFDKWEPYRDKRMLANMGAMGEYSVTELMDAMITEEGPIWDEANRLSGLEFGIGALGAAMGIPIKAYPPGERLQRSFYDDFRATAAAYDAGDREAYQKFYESMPEYKLRLALWDEPEEQMRHFLKDELYNLWNDMPKLHREQAEEVMGVNLSNVLYGEFGDVTEDLPVDELPLEVLQSYLLTLGGDYPGLIQQPLKTEPEWIEPEIANQAQVYYDTMNYLHPGYYDILHDEYTLVPEPLRTEWLDNNPTKAQILYSAWDFKQDFIMRNPEVAPYLSEDEDWMEDFHSLGQFEAAVEQAPQFAPSEIVSSMDDSVRNLVIDFVTNGEELPPVALDELEEFAAGVGLSTQDIMGMLSGGEPDYRFKNYLQDEVYKIWNELPKVHRDQINEKAGIDINELLYMDEEEGGVEMRAQVPTEMWHELFVSMGGKVPGDQFYPELMTPLAKKDTAERAQVYYDTRSYMFPEYFEVMDVYGPMNEQERRAWRNANPTQAQKLYKVWEWTDDFIERNPDVAPYIGRDDWDWAKVYKSKDEYDKALKDSPNLLPFEIIGASEPEVRNDLIDYAYENVELTVEARDELKKIAKKIGIPVYKLVEVLQKANLTNVGGL
jgi:hypothetical protein